MEFETVVYVIYLHVGMAMVIAEWLKTKHHLLI